MFTSHVIFQTLLIFQRCTTNAALCILHTTMLISYVSLQDSFIDKHVAMWTGNFTCNKTKSMDQEIFYWLLNFDKQQLK